MALIPQFLFFGIGGNGRVGGGPGQGGKLNMAGMMIMC